MKLFKIALLAGTHQHRWADDGSGVCQRCGREHSPHTYSRSDKPNVCTVCRAEGKCRHTGDFTPGNADQHQCRTCYSLLEHTRVFDADAHLCWHCTDCGYSSPHDSFTDGVCTTCGWTCTHQNFAPSDSSGHSCRTCGMKFAHSLTLTGTASVCQTCNVCGYHSAHTGISALGQTCTTCGYQHTAHLWDCVSGACTVCHTVCSHPESADAAGRCPICGRQLTRDGDHWIYGTSGGYDGCYTLDRTLTYTGGDSCKIYKGSVWRSGVWTSTGYNLFEFDVYRNITRFGGDYAYRITGYVFTKADSVTVSPSLLTAKGVRHLKLAQYNLDGTLREAGISADGYTASDCGCTVAFGIAPSANWTP